MHRSRQIAQVLAAHGLGTLLDLGGLRRFVPLALRTNRNGHLSQAERLRVALAELGVTFIKLGQTLSTRTDLLPAEFARELAKLQDAVPPVPFEQIRRVIREDLGAEPEALFESFDHAPMASASIGQVHAATLAGGQQVVVKVRRPGVVEEVERDLEILTGIARWIEGHTAVGHDYEIQPIVEEFGYTVRNELDYRREAQNADRLRRFFADDPMVWIPHVYWPTTTQRVLTLERVGGVKLSDLAELDAQGIPRRAVAENAVRIFLRQALELGFFHADPHPGNFFVQPGGAIAIVDFGMVGRLSEELQERLLRAGLAAIQQDSEALAEEMFALGVAGRNAQRKAFQRDLDHLIGRMSGLSLQELSAGEISNDLTAIVYRHKLQLPSELAVLLRVITMSEGLGLSLDPDFHYLEFASPYFRKRWKQRFSVGSTLKRFGRAAADAAELSTDLPRRTGRLLNRVERGEIEISIRHEGLGPIADQFQRMFNRLALAVLLGASVVALGVALGVQRVPGLERYMNVLFALGFVFSLSFGIALIVSIWRAGRK